MELMYPIAIIICFVIVIALFIINFNKKNKYEDGKKVANTKYIKETEYYKNIVKKYNFLSKLLKICSVICILICSVLISRPVTVVNKSDEKNNRDIIMSLDISTSENEVNLELIKKFKEIIPSIEGDRIGLVLYNTAPVVFCPLTEDYDFLNECLDKIVRQLEYIGDRTIVPFSYEENGEEVLMIWDGGVCTGAEIKGSSLVGDGLARNNFFISRFKNRY